eukprot:6509881-Ditylum_brightwellii.AAC.1
MIEELRLAEEAGSSYENPVEMYCDNSGGDSYVAQPSSQLLPLKQNKLRDNKDNSNEDVAITDSNASLQPNSRCTSSKRQKKTMWNNKLNCSSHIHAKDPNGTCIDCKYFNTSADVCTRLGVRCPFNNEYWNMHVVSIPFGHGGKGIWHTQDPYFFQANG